jgi:uncharacterized membrane-anchored protein YhcB (DUF1043 family)
MDFSSIVWNWSQPAALALGVLLGALGAVLGRRRSTRLDRERAEQLAAELDETRNELETHREEVARHFHATSDLFRDLTDRYSRLYAHLAEGAREFCTDEVPALARGFDGPLLGRNGDHLAGDAAADDADAEEEDAAEAPASAA